MPTYVFVLKKQTRRPIDLSRIQHNILSIYFTYQTYRVFGVFVWVNESELAKVQMQARPSRPYLEGMKSSFGDGSIKVVEASVLVHLVI